ncbi:MAG TPA: ABC transporter substrate-binding protein [Acidimicrobiales bacterium]|nr:ABC transporter substrate-binding protein [Acidimicrobiales bacterium]
MSTAGRRPILAVLVLLAACVPVPPTTASAQSPSTTTAPVPRVRVPFPHDDGAPTPYTFGLGYSLVTLVYDTLLWRDDDGVPQPWLAESVETAPDGRLVTIRLDRRARWHDGNAVTAADVAFTFSFVASRPHARFTPQLRAVERVEATDPGTVVVTLRHPSPGFLHQPLADLPILPAHLWRDLAREAAAPAGLPVGSGPYRLVEHRSEGYRFEAVGDYFRGPPAVGAIDVPVIRSFAETMRALERREVDMVPVSLPESSLEELDDPTIRVRQGPSYAGTVLLLNLRRSPFDQAEVRRAVAGALDVVGINRAVGSATPATRGYLHPASKWAPPGPPAPTPAAAPELLRQLPAVELLVTDADPGHLEAARQVVRALRRAGAEAEVRAVGADQLAAAVTGGGAGEPSFSAAIWTAPALSSYDPDFLTALFGSDADRGLLNHGGYRSEAFDAAAERVAAATDEAARQREVAEQLRILAEEVPAVPLLFPTGAFAYRPGVYDGWRFVKGTGLLDKRSFTDPLPAPLAGRDPSRPRASSGSGLSPLGWAAVAVVVAALVVAFVALLSGRR